MRHVARIEAERFSTYLGDCIGSLPISSCLILKASALDHLRQFGVVPIEMR